MAAIGHDQINNYPMPAYSLDGSTAFYMHWCGMIEWMYSGGLGRPATTSERIRLVLLNPYTNFTKLKDY